MSQIYSVHSGSLYVLINKKGETAMDLSGEDNRAVIGYPRHGGPNQQWEFTQLTDGGNKWVIKNHRSGEYLGYEGKPEHGKPLISSKTLVVWQLEHVDPNTPEYRISADDTNLDVDLSDYGNAAPGTPVGIYGRWEGLNQVWLFEQV